MEIIHLGTGAGGVPRAGDAASGHLLRAGDVRLLLDCGNGVLGRLASETALEAVDAVLLSHAHVDHLGDLYPLLLQRRRFERPLRVLAPSGTREKLEAWIRVFSKNPELYLGMLACQEVEPGTTVPLGAARARAFSVEHGVPALGWRVESEGRVVAYTGDTRAGPHLDGLAREADLLVAEATLQEAHPDPGFRERQLAVHMSARQAGEAAFRAGARALALTHVLYYQDLSLSEKEAASAFSGPVYAAKPGTRRFVG